MSDTEVTLLVAVVTVIAIVGGSLALIAFAMRDMNNHKDDL